jgi:hypothetical protein
MQTHGFKLSTSEQVLLDDSYNDAMKARRLLFVWADAILAVLVILALPQWDVSPGITSVIFVAYLLVSAIEKVSYGHLVNGYKALVRRLVARSEDLYHHPERELLRIEGAVSHIECETSR